MVKLVGREETEEEQVVHQAALVHLLPEDHEDREDLEEHEEQEQENIGRHDHIILITNISNTEQSLLS